MTTQQRQQWENASLVGKTVIIWSILGYIGLMLGILFICFLGAILVNVLVFLGILDLP